MYSMKEATLRTGMSYDTIKFYCNKGLVPNVSRDKNNYRIFDDKNINWLISLSCLKNCGMSIADMQQYLSYCLEGQTSIPQRQAMLTNEKEKLLQQLATIQDAIHYIDEKQAFYTDVLAGKVEYISNLTID